MHKKKEDRDGSAGESKNDLKYNCLGYGGLEGSGCRPMLPCGLKVKELSWTWQPGGI
jgi:hypothetical protein